jgi:hypothetical protein
MDAELRFRRSVYKWNRPLIGTTYIHTHIHTCRQNQACCDGRRIIILTLYKHHQKKGPHLECYPYMYTRLTSRALSTCLLEHTYTCWHPHACFRGYDLKNVGTWWYMAHLCMRKAWHLRNNRLIYMLYSLKCTLSIMQRRLMIWLLMYTCAIMINTVDEQTHV